MNAGHPRQLQELCGGDLNIVIHGKKLVLTLLEQGATTEYWIECIHLGLDVDNVYFTEPHSCSLLELSLSLSEDPELFVVLARHIFRPYQHQSVAFHIALYLRRILTPKFMDDPTQIEKIVSWIIQQ